MRCVKWWGVSDGAWDGFFSHQQNQRRPLGYFFPQKPIFFFFLTRFLNGLTLVDLTCAHTKKRELDYEKKQKVRWLVLTTFRSRKSASVSYLRRKPGRATGLAGTYHTSLDLSSPLMKKSAPRVGFNTYSA